jgi:hypothetical protein
MALQPMVDNLGVNGVRLKLGEGLFLAVDGSASTPLVVPGGVTITGDGAASTTIGCPVLITGSQTGLESLWVRPPSTAYGVRIYNGGSPFIARCFFDHVFVGASFKGAGDGPIDGIQLDGAGVIEADHLTVAACTGHGLLFDSTGLEPNTTFKGNVCSFVKNGGFGVRILQSCTLAEFSGGNMENNDAGELYAENVTGVRLLGVDYERGDPLQPPATVTNVIEMQNCNQIEIIGCNMLKTGNATRSFFLAGCNGGIVEGNRFTGWGANGVARISESSRNFRRGVNHIADGSGWFEDYSR